MGACYAKKKKIHNHQDQGKEMSVSKEEKELTEETNKTSKISFSHRQKSHGEMVHEKSENNESLCLVSKKETKEDLPECILDKKKLSSKSDKSQALAKIMEQFRTEYSPSYYSDPEYDDPVEGTKAFMTFLRTNLENYFSAINKIDEGYKPALRFLDTTAAWFDFMETIILEREIGTEGMEKIRKEVSMTAKQIVSQCIVEDSAIDWRIGKKILGIKNKLFRNSKIEKDPLELLESFGKEVDRAIDFLAWKPKDQNYLYTAWTLKKLRKFLKEDLGHLKLKRTREATQKATETTRETSEATNKAIDGKNKETPKEEDIHKRFIKAIVTGRLEKTLFDLENTLILGEDGGLFMLLNNRSYISESLITSNEIISKRFLDSKSKQKTKNKITKTQLTIGEGGFGTVRFALSLFISEKVNPGDVICLKKSKSYEKLEKENSQKDNKISEGERNFEITETTVKDYFASDIAEYVKAPAVLDLALVDDHSISSTHRKGYLMMEVLPQNTGKITFKLEKYQKWEFQKPFLIDILEGTKKILDKHYAQTDLKLDNTLFDPVTRKGTIIDLGGILKMSNAEEIKTFKPSQGGFETTKGYCPPELNAENPDPIDLNLSLVYTCGIIVKEVTIKTDLSEKDVRIKNEIVARTTSEKPEERGSIDKLIDDIKGIGDDKYKENALARAYIERVQEKISKDRSSLSLNEEILTTNEVFIDIDVTKQNSNRLENQETEDLQKLLTDFFVKNEEQVLLLLGAAGSGKSIVLQLKFIEVVLQWEPGKAIPVYFNLANETSLKKNFEILNKQLRTDIDPKKFRLYLFLDSFDEGFDMESKRDKLIKDYLSVLTKDSKILVSCRTEYLANEDDLKWFKSKENNLLYYFIAPFNYGNNKNLRVLARKWLDKKGGIVFRKLTTSQNEEILDRVEKRDIKSIIDTGYIFELVMSTLPQFLAQKEKFDKNLSKIMLYTDYIDIHIEEKVNEISNKQQKRLKELLEKGLKSLNCDFDFKKMFEYFSNRKTVSIYSNKNRRGSVKEERVNVSKNLGALIEILGIYLAFEIYHTGKFRIDCSQSPIFRALGFQAEKPFKDQEIYHALKMLPTKIEMRKHENKLAGDAFYEVQTGFTHDIIKNLFLFKCIDYELKESDSSKILSTKNISKNLEFVRFLMETLESFHRQKLKNFIERTKKDKLKEAAVLAANSMTLLVAMGEIFKDENFEDINIPGANLRSGVFINTSFKRADLRGAGIRYAQLKACDLSSANLERVDFGIFPNLTMDSEVKRVAFSQDGRTLISYHSFPKYNLKSWDIKSGSEIKSIDFNKQQDRLVCFMFSHDDTLLAIGFKQKIAVCTVVK